MKQIFLSITLLIHCSGFLFAQRNTRNNSKETLNQTSFYAELGGPGILFSANLDKRFTKSHLGWGGRIGLGFVSGYLDDSNNFYDVSSVVTVPVQVNYIFGKSNSPHTFEVGGGFTITGKKIDIMDFYDNKSSSFFGTASFMYRRQPINGGFTWRIGFTPLIAKGYIQAFGGVGVGYNF
jgi:hypothetical protein